jgi:hypothetical protein
LWIFDQHMRAENPHRDGDTLRPEQLRKAPDQWLGDIWQGGVGKCGAATLPGIGVKSELRNYKR